jgi:ABC-type Fe3+/spermidine/putrescine transport system ATPase subunit
VTADAPSKNEPAIRIEKLTKRFGSFVAVDAIDLDIQDGEIFSLLGPSGCGKTTTLRLIAGLEGADGGDIYYQGKPVVSVSRRIALPPDKRNMGMVFQSYAIWPHMSVFDNVAYPLKVRGVPSRKRRDRVMQALELVGLQHLADRQAPQLSGGQQQRVALARAIIAEPGVILLDEPFSNLDAKLREQMRLSLKSLLNKLNTTAVFVTHDQVEALALSDRIAVMNAGKVEQVDAPKDVYERPSTPFVRDFLGKAILLSCEVAEAGESPETVSVRLNCFPDAEFLVPRPRATIGLVDSEMVMAVRPEDVSLHPLNGSPRPRNSIPGTVDGLLFVGDQYECEVKLGRSESAMVRLPRASELKLGDSVNVIIAEGAAQVWSS